MPIMAPSQKLEGQRHARRRSTASAWCCSKPEEGVYADGLMIVVGEQGEIDVERHARSARSTPTTRKPAKKELIAEIISHFSL